MENKLENEFKYVGKTFPVQNAYQKARGEEIYTGDINLPNMLYAKLLSSPIAHGKVQSIDVSRAKNLPGVVGVFTHLNTPRQKFNRYITYPGQEEYCVQDQNIFTDTVRFVGDVVAAVVAIDKDIAENAVKFIDVKYDELPVISTMEEALMKDSKKIHAEGNILAEHHIQVGDENANLDGQAVESIVSTQKVHHAAMENHTCVAYYDLFGQMTIWTPCQGAFGVRAVVADFLGLKYNNVRVIKTTMGGSFGGKQEVILELLTAFLAKETKAPVQLEFSREENIIATMTRPATQTRIQTILNQDGRILACNLWSNLDAGAYATCASDYALALTNKITRLYRIPYYRHEARAVYTNTPISGGTRGWGSPEIFAALEIHLDKVAKVMNLNPLELRLKNLVYPGDIDKVSGLSLGNARVIDCLKKGAQEFSWEKRYHQLKNNGRYYRGVGMACAAHVNGMYGDGDFPEFSNMTLILNEDGSFILNTAIHDLGCGAVMAIKQIVAETLDIHPDYITVLEADTSYSPYDLGCFASRTTYVCGACAFKAAQKMKAMLLEKAAAILQQEKNDIFIENGTVKSKRKEVGCITYRDIAVHALMRESAMLSVSYAYQALSNPGAYGVHFAEVEVDPETGLVKVTDYLAVQDIGKAINPGMVEGQVQGAVQMGIGYALSEEVRIDSNGNPLNHGFESYTLLTAADMPPVRVLLVEEGGDDGPYGAKSVGECAAVPVAAAVVNAVNHALGTELSQLPLTPEKIISAFKQKGKEQII
jgi:CO/xanthine dehydrogenase Mo-binding subunit